MFSRILLSYSFSPCICDTNHTTSLHSSWLLNIIWIHSSWLPPHSSSTSTLCFSRPISSSSEPRRSTVSQTVGNRWTANFPDFFLVSTSSVVPHPICCKTVVRGCPDQMADRFPVRPTSPVRFWQPCLHPPIHTSSQSDKIKVGTIHGENRWDDLGWNRL